MLPVLGIHAPLEVATCGKPLSCREQREGKHLLPASQDDWEVVDYSAAWSAVSCETELKDTPTTTTKQAEEKSLKTVYIHHFSNVYFNYKWYVFCATAEG